MEHEFLLSRFNLQSLLLLVTLSAVVFGWAVDRYRLTIQLADEIKAAEKREQDIKIAVQTVEDATGTWIIADAYRDATPDEFREILIYNGLFDLWQLCQNEVYVDSHGRVPASYLAYKILVNLGCESQKDLFSLALSIDQFDLVPDQVYLPGNPEYENYRRFIEKAFTDNSAK